MTPEQKIVFVELSHFAPVVYVMALLACAYVTRSAHPPLPLLLALAVGAGSVVLTLVALTVLVVVAV